MRFSETRGGDDDADRSRVPESDRQHSAEHRTKAFLLHAECHGEEPAHAGVDAVETSEQKKDEPRPQVVHNLPLGLLAYLTKRTYFLGQLQVLMDEGDRHAAFTHAGGDALDGSRPDIAHGEDPGDGSLDQISVATPRPTTGLEDVGAGQHEAARVARDLLGKPVRIGVRPDED